MRTFEQFINDSFEDDEPHVVITIQENDLNQTFYSIYSMEKGNHIEKPKYPEVRTEKQMKCLKLQDYFLEEFKKLRRGRNLNGLVDFLKNDGYEFKEKNWSWQTLADREDVDKWISYTTHFTNKQEVNDFLNIFGLFYTSKELGIY